MSKVTLCSIEAIPRASLPQGKAKATKATKVLQPTTSHNQAGKSLEDIYQKKTQLEHILLRPDTYIGSTEAQQQKLWVHDGEQLVLKDIEYVPGLYKIFDEILVNAADNKVRDPKMDTVKVDIDTVSITYQQLATSSSHMNTALVTANLLQMTYFTLAMLLDMFAGCKYHPCVEQW